MADVLGPSGKPVSKVPVVTWLGVDFPLRVVDPRTLGDTPPLVAMQKILTQSIDQNTIMWAAIHALARDIYLRDPTGERYFQNFAKVTGLHLKGINNASIDVEEDLKKIELTLEH